MARVAGAGYVAALRAVERLRGCGFAAYFAGGCVRDLLLGVEPKDFDVATSATPDVVQGMFARTEAVGAHFGVVLVIDKVASPPGLKPLDLLGSNVRAEARTYSTEGVETGVAMERVATEVATFRHDGAYSDGRRPDAVRFSTDAREDVLRRDFTINGLLLDAVAFEAGESVEDCVLDFVGGREDLRAGMVRAIGDPGLRFAEDRLRMLRAVRFAARLGFAIEAQTLRAMQEQAAGMAQVSAERVREELTKILIEGAARRGFELLDEAGLLVELLPEVKRMQGVEQPPQYHPEGDVWVHTLMLLEHLGGPGLKPISEARGDGGLKPTSTPSVPISTPSVAISTPSVPTSTPSVPISTPSATLAWGMLLHDVGKPPTFTPPDPAKAGDRIRFNGHVEVGVAMARVILNRLRFSNEDAAQILALVQHHMQFGDVMKMKQSTLKRFLRLPLFEEHLALHRADVMSSNKNLALYEFATERLAELGEEAIRPELLMTGAELIANGYRPGPRFKTMLMAAEDAQLEGVVTTREGALAFIRQKFGAPE